MNRTKSFFFPVLTVALVMLFVGCNWLFGPRVYTSVKVGESNAGIAGNDGTLHVLFSFNTQEEHGNGVSFIYYACGNPAAGWTNETVYAGAADYLTAEAIGLDPSGLVHAFYRYGRVTCHAVRTAGGSWTSEVLNDDEAGPVGDVAFDADGGIHVSHSMYKTDTVALDNLRPLYSYKAPGGTWVKTPINTGAGWVDVNYGRESSLAVDSAGKAHIVFGRQGNILPLVLAKLYYATAEAGGGTVSDGRIISDSVTGSVTNDITVGPDGTLHITFLGYLNPSGKLRYLRSVDGGTTWLPSGDVGELVDSTEVSGVSSKNILDSSGNLRTAYLANPDEAIYPKLKLAVRNTGGAWTLEEPDPAITCYGEISYMITPDDTTYVVYNEDTGEGQDTTYTRLMIAKKVPGEAWVSSIIMGTDLPEE